MLNIHVAVAARVLEATRSLPVPLDRYHDPSDAGLWETLVHRVVIDPFNAVALAIFLAAIVHTFLTAKFRHWSHLVEQRHRAREAQESVGVRSGSGDALPEVSFGGQLLHFLGEVEAVFGIWVVVLAVAITAFKGWPAVVDYIGEHVNYTEPLFVVIIMALAATQPVLGLAERLLRRVAGLGRGTPAAWWLAILLIAPLLGSLITEPAAMTIAASLLARQFYDLQPSARLSYATLGSLFVNVSVGGTLTHFAAPPVIMVAHPWGWNLSFMFMHFGWRAIIGIVASTLIYLLIFRQELTDLAQRSRTGEPGTARPDAPFWITGVHLAFIAFTVWQAHQPVLFIGAFLFFLAFAQATAHHQTPLDLRPPILVGFFLAGLVIHGGLQSWWIEPILRRLGERSLFAGATLLTAFNDNAAVTYLATLVPGLTEPLKFAVVAGAVAGGGLTVIANAPNPAGQTILSRYFPEGVAPLRLFAGALIPTLVVAVCFTAL